MLSSCKLASKKVMEKVSITITFSCGFDDYFIKAIKARIRKANVSKVLLTSIVVETKVNIFKFSLAVVNDISEKPGGWRLV